MIRWETAWKRAVSAGNTLIKGKKITDFRPQHYNQTFSAVPMGTTTQTSLQTFPAGAFILGISASGTLPVVCHPDQYYADPAAAPLDSTFDRLKSATAGNRDLFGLDFAYTNNEQIVSGGPAQADALLGSGRGTEFPSRELIVDPSQGILARVQNLITTQLISGGAAATGISLPISVFIVYKCMVPRAVG